MNKKAIELMNEAGLLMSLGGPYPRALNAEGCMTAYHKLVELVVKECVSLLPDDCIAADGCHPSHMIFEHFGVK